VSAGRYTVFPGAVDLNRPGQPYGVDLAAAPYSVSLVSADFGGASAVTFNGYGAPSSGGQVVVASGNQQRTIRLNAPSGVIAIQ
jgi:hypothetical protein